MQPPFCPSAPQFGPKDERGARKLPELHRFKYEAPSEGTLIGARNIHPYNGVTDWTCRDEKHWAFAGTGMRNGDGIPGLLGFEWMGAPADIPGLQVLAQGPVKFGGDVGTYAATIYPGPKGNFVFNASTIFWSQALSSPPGHMLPWSHWSRPHGPDERVQRITHNLLKRALGGN